LATQQEIGEKGEQLAQEHLLRLGYKILDTNYQYGHLELDIVAKDGDELVIVEVKARSGLRYEHPSEAVTDSKIKRIVDAAEGYIQDKNWEGDTRFDVITVIFFRENHELEHFKEAFYPTL
jgi:putative endonuclease